MQFFDLHCHPGLKTLFKPQDGGQFTAWHDLNPARLFGDILSSQCSLEQVSRNGNIPLVCITLHAPEAGMIDQLIIRLGAAILFKAFMDPLRLRDMYTGEAGYNQVFTEELHNLQQPPDASDNIPAGKKIVFLQKWADYNPALPGTVHVIFNIEGGHNLYDQGNGLSAPENAFANLDAFLDRGFLTLYLTPTHLTPNVFINHAYGNKILTRGPLLPQGMGITNAGMRLIGHAYSNKLLIDVKHMSLLSRLEFYRIHAEHYPEKPIIASHIGLTGMPLAEWRGWVRRVKPMGSVVELMSYKYQWPDRDTSFYPLTINLFTEDILAILKSKGLIGLSMDVRITGGKETIDDPQYDYLSVSEYDVLRAPDSELRIAKLADDLWAGRGPDAAAAAVVPADPSFDAAIKTELNDVMPVIAVPPDRPYFDFHARQLAYQLLKIMDITRAYNQPHPWDHLCIGSDFDGLVEAVDCCKNAAEFGLLAPALEKELAEGAAALKLDLQLSPAEIVSKFCYTNAFNFINRHFNV